MNNDEHGQWQWCGFHGEKNGWHEDAALQLAYRGPAHRPSGPSIELHLVEDVEGLGTDDTSELRFRPHFIGSTWFKMFKFISFAKGVKKPCAKNSLLQEIQ